MPAIAIADADGVTIRNNTFEDPAGPNTGVKLLIRKSDHVTVTGNHQLPDSAIDWQ